MLIGCFKIHVLTSKLHSREVTQEHKTALKYGMPD